MALRVTTAWQIFSVLKTEPNSYFQKIGTPSGFNLELPFLHNSVGFDKDVFSLINSNVYIILSKKVDIINLSLESSYIYIYLKVCTTSNDKSLKH